MRLVQKAKISLLAFIMVFSLVVQLQPQQAKAGSAADSFTWDNANVYFVMTDRFYDGNSSNNNSYGRVVTDATGKRIGTFHGGDIKGLTAKLNEGYFTGLGTNAIWISAPYEQIHGFVGGGNSGDFAHYAYHGYYPLDYTEVDKNMGTVEEFRQFVDTAHGLGIRVVLDVVLNHAGYNTIKDMQDYGFGTLLNGLNSSWAPGSGENWHSYHNKIDYTSSVSDWARWWGSGWIRAGVAGYTAGGSNDLTQNLSGLPDFKTEVTTSQGLPPILQTKWAAEGTGNDSWVVPAAKSLRSNLGIAPADYIVKWLASWVKEFGIDGFRADTAKHVDISRWAQLKTEANTALAAWRANNPAKAGASWTDPFWMTAEVWGHGVGRSAYFDNGFDSVINFAFQDANKSDLDSLFSSYATALNSDADSSFNVLSYLSTHDTKLYDRSSLIAGGTALLLLPGGVQTFYGDETGRPPGENGSDSTQGTRSDMNWSSVDSSVLSHWQKLGQFRNHHPAIGAGTHTKISSSPYTFSRTYTNTAKGIDDKVVIATGASGSTSVNVGGIWPDGATVKDFYTGNLATVSNGQAVFTAGSNGVILLELHAVSTDPYVSASPAGGSFTGGSIDVTLSVGNAASGTYTVDGTTPSAANGIVFTNGAVVKLGSSLAAGESVTLKLFAAANNLTASQSYTFTKTDGLTIHFKKPASWGAPYLYYYGTTPAVTGPTWATAPAMTDEGNGYYKYTIAGAANANIIFKDANGNQTPASGQAGFLRSSEGWYDGTTSVWHDTNPVDTIAPTAPSNLTSTAHTDATATLEWTAATDNVAVTGYKLYRNGAEAATVTSGTAYTDTGLTGSTTYAYHVAAYDAAGNASAASNEITVTTEATTGNTVTVYYKSGYTTPYIHYRPEGGTWTTAPGTAMTASEISGYFKTTVSTGSAARLEAVFNNGSGTWDNNGGSNYFFNKGTSTYFPGGTIVEGAPTAADQVTLVVNVPGTTTASDTLFLAGSLNNWVPNDNAYQLTRRSDGKYQITLSVASGTAISYKITRGSWASVEATSSGADITNRTYTAGTGNQGFTITVVKWKDK